MTEKKDEQQKKATPSHVYTHGHSHSHSHSRSHSHSHVHYPAGTSTGRMAGALVLNLTFAIVELIGGIWTNSLAIMSDALHDFGDALALAIALGLEKYSNKKSDLNFSYGYKRFSTLGALITGGILVVGSLAILSQSIPRLFSPSQPHADGMILLAILGVVVNGFAALRVSKGTSLNEKMLMWHMIEDVLGWVVVLVGSVVMKYFDVPQLDAWMAIALAGWILYNVARNLKEALQVFLMAAPKNIDRDQLELEIRKNPEVVDVHHSHLWSLDGENHIYTAHLVVTSISDMVKVEALKSRIKKDLRKFGVFEATLEIELQGVTCSDPQHDQ